MPSSSQEHTDNQKVNQIQSSQQISQQTLYGFYKSRPDNKFATGENAIGYTSKK